MCLKYVVFYSIGGCYVFGFGQTRFSVSAQEKYEEVRCGSGVRQGGGGVTAQEKVRFGCSGSSVSEEIVAVECCDDGLRHKTGLGEQAIKRSASGW